MPEKELLTAVKAAERLTITKRTLLKWARENRIDSVRLSKKVVIFTAEAIDEFVKSREHEVEPAPINHQAAGRKMTSSEKKKGGG